MDLRGIGKLMAGISARSVLIAVVVGVAVVVPFVWLVRQSQRTEEALARAIAAERSAERAQSRAERSHAFEEDQIRIRRDDNFVRAAHKPSAADIERTRQLSEEIEGLSAIHEKIQQDLHELKARAAAEARNPRPSYPLP